MSIPHEAAHLARRQHGIVARRQLIALGVNEGSVSKHAAHAGWRHLYRGVYALPGAIPSYEQDVMAAVLAAGDGALASHLTAAYLHGVLDPRPPVVDVLLPFLRRAPRLEGVHVTRSRTLGPNDRCLIRGIPATTLPRTIIDAATVLEPPDIRALLIDARQRRRLDLGGVARRLLTVGPLRNSGELRHCLYQMAPAKVDSVLEALVRDLLNAPGVPAPHPSVYKVRLGDRTVELDIAWPGLMVCIEVDGWGAHSGRRAMDADHRKQNALTLAGWLVLRVSWDRIVHDPEGFVAEVAAVLEARMCATQRL